MARCEAASSATRSVALFLSVLIQISGTIAREARGYIVAARVQSAAVVECARVWVEASLSRGAG